MLDEELYPTETFHTLSSRGLTPRLAMYMTQGALIFASYESFKRLLSLEVPELSPNPIEHEALNSPVIALKKCRKQKPPGIILAHTYNLLAKQSPKVIFGRIGQDFSFCFFFNSVQYCKVSCPTKQAIRV